MLKFRKVLFQDNDQFKTASWILGARLIRQLKFIAAIQGIFAFLDVAFLALIAAFISSISGKELPILLKRSFLLNYSSQFLFFLIVIVVIAKNLGGVLLQRITSRVLSSREAEVSTFLLQSYLVNYNYKLAREHSSEMSGIFTVTLTNIFTNLFKPCMTAISECATVLAVSIGLIIMSPFVALASIGYFTLLGTIYSKILSARQKKSGQIALAASRSSMRLFSEIVRSKKEIRTSNLEDLYLKEVYQKKKTLTNMQGIQAFYQQLPRYFLEVGLIVGLSVLIFCWPNHHTKEIFPVLGLLVAAGYRILPSVNMILIVVAAIKQTWAPLNRLFEVANEYHIFNRPISVEFPTRHEAPVHFGGSLIFDRVNFCYIEGSYVLEDLSITIPSNETIWISGPSGSGKTTFLDLACGFLFPDSGSIEFGEKDNFIPMGPNVVGIGYLGPESVLFDEDVLFNITLRPAGEHEEKRIWQVLESVGLAVKVSQMQDGLKTLIGEEGGSLSTGEKKRLILARLLFADNRLLILDEPTANLDESSEAGIFEVLERLHHTSTIILVSHKEIPKGLFDTKITFPVPIRTAVDSVDEVRAQRELGLNHK